jgi:hypothetical protein
VFGVEQQPVEAGKAENFGGDRVCKRAPAANEAFAGKDALTKSVRESGVGYRGKESGVAGVPELQEVNTYITGDKKVIVSKSIFSSSILQLLNPDYRILNE